MSGPKATKGARRSPREGPMNRSDGDGKRPSRKRNVLLIIVLSLAICAVVLAATLANSSSRGLDIQKGDSMQYSLASYTGQKNASGSLIIEVTNQTSNSYEITYAITLENKTTRTVVQFTGASGAWSSNIANVMNKLSGSSSSATATNETEMYTVYGTKQATEYTIDTTTKSGIGLHYTYWLASTNNCPLQMALLYGNGDIVTATLVYTNIAEFQS